MNSTEERFYTNVKQLEELVKSNHPSIKRNKEVENFNGRRSNTCFKKVHTVEDVGTKFGNLTLTGYIVGTQGGLKDAIVRCNCGSPEFTVTYQNLRRLRTKNCMLCGKKTANASRKRYWGYEDILPDQNHRTRLLDRISAALQRCHNPNDKNYPNYGGRGIEVHEPWRNGTEGRRNFLTHLITLDGWDIPNFDMDRIDTNKGYEPGNLRFVTRSQNMNNKRKVQEMQDRINYLVNYVKELEARLSQ